MNKPACWCRPVVKVFFSFFAPYRWLCLHRVLIAESSPPLGSDRAVLLCANHVSWWDGFLLRAVHHRLAAHMPLYTVMLSAQRQRFFWFRWMGALGIDPGNVGSLRRLFRFLHQERKRRPYWLAFFPQGKIRPSFARPLRFQPGIRLMVRAVHPGWIIPVALHLEPLRYPGPTAFVILGRPIDTTEDPSPEMLEAATQNLLDRLLMWLSEVGEDAEARWPQFVADLVNSISNAS
ncbi:lysophospholipid acyltransferase family protein [Rhodothermus bifroesti]|uniref:Phospholipid/glycerol acyltransferase domain-containing protein n=1 Tax=Rhodothermus marinus TaxID=29549 RepID=A0A7V2AYK8_RHOMR|nr:lysophospholipid acyltransferase family protein [Rhodothermus bifroesti]